MIQKARIGERAYHLRRTLGLPWPQIADHLGYRVGRPRIMRADGVLNAAKRFAERNGHDWPPPRSAHA